MPSTRDRTIETPSQPDTHLVEQVQGQVMQLSREHALCMTVRS